MAVYITGDKHRDYDDVALFCKEHSTTKDDLLIVLGDNGVNYYGDKQGDYRVKRRLQKLPITFMMIRGNHDMRPTEAMGYQLTKVDSQSCCGWFLVQPEFPNLLFARDGAFYTVGDGKNVFVAGGAYSVDKYYRLLRDLHWFEDEQLSANEMDGAELLLEHGCRQYGIVDAILTHTCPYKYRPVDLFIPGLNQSNVDHTMEQWLDALESRYPYKKWYCGHWHTDRVVDKLRFMYHDIILFE